MANVVVIGAQWGDEGKGKIVDWLAERADIVVRFQGGHNAGHTLVVGENVYKLSLLPSGIVRGTPSVIGNGVVLDPWALKAEIERLADQGVVATPDTLRIADSCALILPLLWPLGAAGAVLAAPCPLLLRHRAGRTDGQPELAVRNPFELLTVLRLAAVIALIMLLARIMTEEAGAQALLAVAAISGLVDVDALTLSLSRMAESTIAPATAVADLRGRYLRILAVARDERGTGPVQRRTRRDLVHEPARGVFRADPAIHR